MSQLLIVRGLPGSGKTTFAVALAKKHWTDAILFAADDHFMKDGEYRFSMRELGDAHKWCQRKVLESLQHGKNVIVHNTFTTAREFEPYLEMSARTKVDFRVYNLYDGGLTDEELAERNVHGVQLETIKRMRERWARAPINEMHVSVVDNYAHWQYPTIENGEFKYRPDWVEMT